MDIHLSPLLVTAMLSLTDYILSKGHYDIEGYSQQIPQQVADLCRILDHVDAVDGLRVLEIGFNAGHSAEVFLRHPKVSSVVSFDLGSRPYVPDGKAYIDAVYGSERHTLVLGDSTVTVPAYVADHPAAEFDVLFVDGGHDLMTATADLRHCIELASAHAVIVVDDVVQRPDWVAEYTVGPTAAVRHAVEAGRFQVVGASEYGVGRGMCWGKATR